MPTLTIKTNFGRIEQEITNDAAVDLVAKDLANAQTRSISDARNRAEDLIRRGLLRYDLGESVTVEDIDPSAL